MKTNNNIFNDDNRTINTVKASFWGTTKSIFDIVLGFVYRTIFISILSADYLGLNGLFTNLLQVLSLAELGITTAIVYRFYEPISKKDVFQVGKLMNYLRIVYRNIASIILLLGLIITPFIKWFIKDTDSIPKDVNIYVIYLLFLLNTVSSYLFIYKQTILSADQRAYIVSFWGLIASLLKYFMQIAVLLVIKDYTISLLSGIIITIITNIIISKWTQVKYREIFDVCEDLNSDEKKEIINDTKAVMFHKVGATVKTSTDSLVLSKFVSLSSTGIYSNYSMIIIGLQSLISQLLGNFVSSVGNAHVELEKKQNYSIYKKLLFIDLWISTVTVVCLYTLINDFIVVWIGEDFLFDRFTLIMLCTQFYIIISRQINISYTNGCGLFARDKYRPIIEAFLNLFFSIIGVKLLGIVGVFIGTVISSILTVCWREPIILYREEFNESVWNYWKMYSSFVTCAIVFCALEELFKLRIGFGSISFIFLLFESFVSFFLINFMLIILYRRKSEYSFMKLKIKSIIRKKLNKEA